MGAVKNFAVGLLLGVLAMYWYLTQRDYTQSLLVEMWSRASGPPAAPRANHPY
jgi:hypothetical protein